MAIDENFNLDRTTVLFIKMWQIHLSLKLNMFFFAEFHILVHVFMSFFNFMNVIN